MKRKFFFWHWYSICSRHSIGYYNDECSMCQAGSWVGPVSRYKSRRWYKTHWYDGNYWHKK